MVAGILEKSKRVRKVVFFAIRYQTPSSMNAGNSPRAQALFAPTLRNALAIKRRQVRARRDVTPHRRQSRRVALFQICRSAPVLQACSRSAARGTVANPFQRPFSASLGCEESRVTSVKVGKRC